MTNKANTFIEEKELIREVNGATLDFYNKKIIEMSLSKIDEYIQLINFCKSNNIKEKVLNVM
jgi:hypothetical protein